VDISIRPLKLRLQVTLPLRRTGKQVKGTRRIFLPLDRRLKRTQLAKRITLLADSGSSEVERRSPRPSYSPSKPCYHTLSFLHLL